MSMKRTVLAGGLVILAVGTLAMAQMMPPDGGAVPAQYKDEAWVRSFVGGTPPRHDPVAEGARDGA